MACRGQRALADFSLLDMQVVGDPELHDLFRRNLQRPEIL